LNILALETTERIGSLAVAQDDNLLLHLRLSEQMRSAQSVAPGLRHLLDRIGWKPSDVDLVALTIGPGSFTGLRIGVATAKAFAYAVGAEVLGVDTLETIAAAAPSRFDRVAVAVDAQRGEVVAATFTRGVDGRPKLESRSCLLEVETWIEQVPPGVPLSGPILRRIASRLPPGTILTPEATWAPKASIVARLAARHYAAGRRDDLWKLAPVYSRQSAAEEKWARRNQPAT